MVRASLIIFLSTAAVLPTGSLAQDAMVGVAVPLSGGFGILGRQMQDGARVAAKAEGFSAVAIADTGCTADGAKAAANRLVQDKARLVVGFLCTEAIEAAMPVFKKAGIPVLTPAVRTASLTDRRDRTGWPVFRMAARDDAEEKAVADILVDRWRDTLFAIVDDGTIYGRDLAENFRAAAEMAGLKPTYVDTYRPQLDNQIGLAGRLKRSGATHVFVGGDRNDIAIIARDAAKLGYKATVAGGEALRSQSSAVPLAEGTLMVGLPQWADVAGKDALTALGAEAVQPEGYVLPAYAAMQIAIEAVTRAGKDDRPVADILAKEKFETALGTIRFDDKGDSEGSPYRLFRYDGGRFVEVR